MVSRLTGDTAGCATCGCSELCHVRHIHFQRSSAKALLSSSSHNVVHSCNALLRSKRNSFGASTIMTSSMSTVYIGLEPIKVHYQDNEANCRRKALRQPHYYCPMLNLATDCQLVSDEYNYQLHSATSRTCVVRRTYSNYGDR